ncbi:MAG: recombinase, partial [Cruoricaptor ignavus]|nr:recombinase [Cruoricaptor ignavus]
MKFFTSHKSTFQSVLRKYFSFRTETKSLDPLYEVFEGVKKVSFDEVLDFFKEDKEIAENFGYYLRNLFDGKPFNLSLTEANIISENGFVPELRKRVLNSILPPVENENSIWFLVDYISVRPGKDLEYLKNIPENQLAEVFEILGISRFIRKKKVIRELVFSANILAWRAIGNALDIEVMNMVPNYKNFDNPFLALQDEMDLLKVEFRKNPEFYLSAKSEHYKQIKIYLEQCLAFVEEAFKNSDKYGISSKTNQSLLKIRQQVVRISEVINLLVINSEEDEIRNSISLVFNILKYKSNKNDVAELFNDNTRLISHLITNHTAETGVHYITSGIKDYLQMFWKASAGGVIVGSLCVLKM